MVKNITIGELEILATTRVLCQRIKNREVFDRSDFLKQAFFSANDILRECGLNGEVWFRQRGQRVFLFNEIDRKILAELQIDCQTLPNSQIIRPKMILLGRRGFLREKTVGDLLARNLRRDRRNNQNRRFRK